MEFHSVNETSENVSLLSFNSTWREEIGGLAFLRKHAQLYVPYMVVVSMTTVFGTIGNILLICVIIRSKELRTTANLLLINMAIGDMLVACIANGQSLVGLLFGEHVFHHPEGICVMLAFITRVVSIAALMTLPAVACNRYIKVCRSPIYERIFSLRNTILISAAIWVYAIASQFLQFIGWARFGFDRKAVGCMNDRTAHISATLFSAAVYITIPGSVSAFCYLQIYLFVRASKRRVNALSRSTASQKVDISLSMTLFLIWIVYFACLLPFCLIFVLDSSDTLPIWPFMYTLALAYSNSMLNPILYGVTNQSFRKGFIAILRLDKVCNTNDATTQSNQVASQTTKISVVPSAQQP